MNWQCKKSGDKKANRYYLERVVLVGMALVLALAALPMILMEYFITRERVTDSQDEKSGHVTLRTQMKACLKSRSWVALMVYLVILNLINSFFSAGTFYYCNWVLGSYNDGITQAVFYALGQAPLGIGIMLCGPRGATDFRPRCLTVSSRSWAEWLWESSTTASRISAIRLLRLR